MSDWVIQELGLNLRGLVPSTRVDWIGTDMIGKERERLERKGLERIDQRG